MPDHQLTLDDFFRRGIKAQRAVDEILLARKNDPETSKDAAHKLVESGRLTKQEWLVYDVLKRHARPAGYTAKELAYLIDDKDYKGDNTKKYLMVDRRFSGLFNKGKAKIVTVLIDGYKENVRRNGCYAWEAI